MFKAKFKQLIMAVFTAVTVLTVLNGFSNINVKADDVASSKTNNAIWMKDSTGRSEIQQLGPNNTIYYAITTPKSNAYYQVWQAAAKLWTNLGVINLQQVANNDPRKEITLNGNYRHMTKKQVVDYGYNHHINIDTSGDSNSNFWMKQVDSNNDTAYMCDTVATLTPGSWADTPKAIINVAQHELGHALGFDHDATRINGRKLIMNAYTNGSSHPLGNTERQLLLQHYGPFLNQNNSSDASISQQNNSSDQSSSNGNQTD